MVNGKQEIMSYVQRLFGEHRRLKKLVDVIREDLAGCNFLEETDSRQNLIRDLEQLHGELTRHFAEEDEGACIEEAVSRNPSVAAQADRLEGDHEMLLDRLREIVETFKTLVPSSAAAKDVAAIFDEFADALLAHETAENRIMERGFNVDLELENG